MRAGRTTSLFHVFHASLSCFSVSSVMYRVVPKTSGSSEPGMSVASNRPDTGDNSTALRVMHQAAFASHALHVLVETGMPHAE